MDFETEIRIGATLITQSVRTMTKTGVNMLALKLSHDRVTE